MRRRDILGDGMQVVPASFLVRVHIIILVFEPTSLVIVLHQLRTFEIDDGVSLRIHMCAVVLAAAEATDVFLAALLGVQAT